MTKSRFLSKKIWKCKKTKTYGQKLLIIDMEKKTIKELITQVETSASSIFSKSDVLEILKSIETSDIKSDDLKKELRNLLADTDYFSYLDESSASFSITDNLVYLSDFQLSTDELADDIMDGLSYLFDEHQKADYKEEISIQEPKGCGPECVCKKKKKKEK